MIVCVAVDDNGGMLFNNRRQSMDWVLRKDILQKSQGNRLWMNAYTRSQFTEPEPEEVMVDEDFLNKAGKGEICFVENIPLHLYEDKIEKLILYKWNRAYPADMYLDIEINDNTWRLISVSEFEGNSHKKITKEVWGNGKESI